MILTNLDNGNVEVGLQPCDVESAIRQFICACHPELNIGFVINPKADEADRLPTVSFIAENHFTGVEIIVNAQKKEWKKHTISYEEILELAGKGPGASVTYGRGASGSGMLHCGKSTGVKHGMIINCMFTGNA